MSVVKRPQSRGRQWEAIIKDPRQELQHKCIIAHPVNRSVPMG